MYDSSQTRNINSIYMYIGSHRQWRRELFESLKHIVFFQYRLKKKYSSLPYGEAVNAVVLAS